MVVREENIPNRAKRNVSVSPVHPDRRDLPVAKVLKVHLVPEVAPDNKVPPAVRVAKDPQDAKVSRVS